MRRYVAILLVSCLSVAGCDKSSPTSTSTSDTPFDSARAAPPAVPEVSLVSQNRSMVPALPSAYAPSYWGSGHQAGYDWAEENDIGDPDDCGGNSDSFIEGCEEYAQEQVDAPAEDGASERNEGDPPEA